MKNIAIVTLFLFSSICAAQDRESLLNAWEARQKTSPEVEAFEKIADLKYKIKLAKLPFEGQLNILAYDVEEITRGSDETFTKMGYVEVELVGAPDNLYVKYGRTYYKWMENNTLYLNSTTGEWVTGREYSKALESQYENDMPGDFALIFLEYWNYILAVIILYFVISTVRNNKNIKASLAFQHQAQENMEKTFLFQDEARKLHQETNQLLEKIYEALKKE